MPRVIANEVMRGTSAVYRRDLDEDFDPDLDTADRATRDRVMRGPMHATRDNEHDARNTPRMEHADIAWRQPMSLDAPPPMPGMTQRWIRMRRPNDPSHDNNEQAKARSGWMPRDPASVPEGEMFFSTSTKSLADGGVIRVGNMVLHEIPTHLLKQQRARIRAVSRHQEESVSMETDRASREGVRAGYDPIVREEKGTVTTGRRPSTLAD